MEAKTERVIEAAKRVFMQYGYQHVTMGDIATAAGMSRPALYLVYPSKVEIFTAALENVLDASLVEIREGLEREATIDHKLKLAFDIWCVRPYEMVLASPDAKDLLESGRLFARELVEREFGAFEHLLALRLTPLVRAQSRVKLPAIQIARLMVAAVLGFKQQARDVAHLRHMIAGQIALVLASLR